MWIFFVLKMTLALVTAQAAPGPDPVTVAIDQAQGMALKRDRRAACDRLRTALNDTPLTAKASRARLLEALSQLDKVFFTDKGQKDYEAGQVLMFENPDLALSKFRAALTVEDGNLSVLVNMAKSQLVKQDCDGAASSISQARGLNPFAAEPALLELRVLVCQKRFADLHDKAKQVPGLEKWEDQYLQYLLALNHLEQNNSRRAFEVLAKVTEEQPAFPEPYFYLARAGLSLNKDNQTWLRKYVTLCQKVPAKDRRRFSLEPRLCANLKEAEDELAKKATDL